MGAGLLAKAEYQSPSLLNLMTPSRASPLPHLNLVASTCVFQLSPSSRQIRTTCRRSSTNWSPGITPASFCKASLLREAYKAYRSAAHRQALQKDAGVIPGDQFVDERRQVLRIWRELGLS